MKITKQLIIGLLLINLTSLTCYAEETTKTPWGELPVELCAKIDEISNGSASAYLIQKKCTNKSEAEIIKSTKEQTNKMIVWISKANYYLGALRYSDDSFSQKIKAFNLIYSNNTCDNLNEALYILAESNHFNIKANND